MYSANQSKKKPIFFLIISIVLIIAFLFIAFAIPSFIKKPTKANTITKTATIKNIEKEQNGKTYRIYTEEYGKKIMIHNSRIIMNMDLFLNLKEGDTITFSIEKTWEPQFDDIDFVYIVTLQTENQDIITLASYNKLLEKDFLKIKITACSSAVIFLLISIHCILLIKGINIFTVCRKNKKMIKKDGCLFSEDARKWRIFVLLLAIVFYALFAYMLVYASIKIAKPNQSLARMIPAFLRSVLFLAVAILWTCSFNSRYLKYYMFITQNEIKFFANNEAHEYNISDLKNFEFVKYKGRYSNYKLTFADGNAYAVSSFKARDFQETIQKLIVF